MTPMNNSCKLYVYAAVHHLRWQVRTRRLTVNPHHSKKWLQCPFCLLQLEQCVRDIQHQPRRKQYPRTASQGELQQQHSYKQLSRVFRNNMNVCVRMNYISDTTWQWQPWIWPISVRHVNVQVSLWAKQTLDGLLDLLCGEMKQNILQFISV